MGLHDHPHDPGDSIADTTTPRCGAKLHKRDGTCTLPAGWGTQHQGFGRCRKHAGNSPGGIKNARELALREQAAEALARLDAPPVDDPLTELARLAGQVVAWKDSMAAKVNELTDLRFTSALGAEQLRGELALWERALDRCAAVLSGMARLDIDARLVRIEEAKARMIAEAVRAALASTGASIEQQQEAKRVIARRLTVVPEVA